MLPGKGGNPPSSPGAAYIDSLKQSRTGCKQAKTGPPNWFYRKNMQDTSELDAAPVTTTLSGAGPPTVKCHRNPGGVNQGIRCTSIRV